MERNKGSYKCELCGQGDKTMNDTTISNALVPFAGSGFLGYICGFFLKKILKWIMIICGTILGAFFCGLLALQSYGYISPGSLRWEDLAILLRILLNHGLMA